MAEVRTREGRTSFCGACDDETMRDAAAFGFDGGAECLPRTAPDAVEVPCDEHRGDFPYNAPGIEDSAAIHPETFCEKCELVLAEERTRTGYEGPVTQFETTAKSVPCAKHSLTDYEGPDGRLLSEDEVLLVIAAEGKPILFRVCCSCGKTFGSKPCEPKMNGQRSHGYCPPCADVVRASLRSRS